MPLRVYTPDACAAFRRLADPLGALSNMALELPLAVSGVSLSSSEALYQAMRFPHLPEVQRLVADAPSPQTAKQAGVPFLSRSRPDWDAVRVEAMRWTLRVKLAQHRARFGDVLLSTGTLPIVEVSTRDDFWGAKPLDDGTYAGTNTLGILLTELRDALRSDPSSLSSPLPPPSIPGALLFGRPIPEISPAPPPV